MLSGFLGNRIKIVKADGYVKFGILRGEDDNFILLEFRDGNREMINKRDISSLKLDGDSDE